MRKTLLATEAVFVSIVPFEVMSQAEPAPETEGPGDGVVEAILINEALQIMLRNIEASERESGEIDKLIRALSGVSIKDINEYGICGGPNSEVRKLFGSLCDNI